MNEQKDFKLKYVEMPGVFYGKATDLRIACKQQLKACERLAKHLAKKKSKNAQEFEQDEWLKDFIIKTAEVNEKTLGLLDYVHSILKDVAADSDVLLKGADIRDQMVDQSDAVIMLQNQRDKLVNELFNLKRNSGITQ